MRWLILIAILALPGCAAGAAGRAHLAATYRAEQIHQHRAELAEIRAEISAAW